MPKKNQITKFQIISSGNMSVSSIVSSVSSIEFLDDVGIQLNWSGSPTGTFSVQVSADYSQDTSSPPNVTNAGNWAPLVLTYWTGSAFVTTTAIPTSLGSPIYLDLALLSAPWIRTVYTKTSGSGTLDAFITAKSVSG